MTGFVFIVGSTFHFVPLVRCDIGPYPLSSTQRVRV